jgi:hypothetical protein
MLVIASIANEFAAGTGLLAASIAVLGFIGQAYPALSGAPEQRIRQAVAVGGLVGLSLGGFVILLSAILGV